MNSIGCAETVVSDTLSSLTKCCLPRLGVGHDLVSRSTSGGRCPTASFASVCGPCRLPTDGPSSCAVWGNRDRRKVDYEGGGQEYKETKWKGRLRHLLTSISSATQLTNTHTHTTHHPHTHAHRMFAAIVAPVRSSFAQRGVRTVVTVAKANSAPATTTAAAASPTATAGMSTTATQSAPLKHTVDAYGRVTSMNR